MQLPVARDVCEDINTMIDVYGNLTFEDIEATFNELDAIIQDYFAQHAHDLLGRADVQAASEEGRWAEVWFNAEAANFPRSHILFERERENNARFSWLNRHGELDKTGQILQRWQRVTHDVLTADATRIERGDEVRPDRLAFVCQAMSYVIAPTPAGYQFPDRGVLSRPSISEHPGVPGASEISMTLRKGLEQSARPQPGHSVA